MRSISLFTTGALAVTVTPVSTLAEAASTMVPRSAVGCLASTLNSFSALTLPTADISTL